MLLACYDECGSTVKGGNTHAPSRLLLSVATAQGHSQTCSNLGMTQGSISTVKDMRTYLTYPDLIVMSDVLFSLATTGQLGWDRMGQDGTGRSARSLESVHTELAHENCCMYARTQLHRLRSAGHSSVTQGSDG
jgi:hypothetical protein